jgi:hypothetical protein
MNRQILNTFAVTLAFGAGAIITALVLDIRAVQAYLGMPSLPAQDLVQAGMSFVGIALVAGLLVDGLRLLAAKLLHKNRQLQHDLEDLFRNSLV